MKNRKNVSLWILYDFANSLAQIVFVIYFAQWLVIEQGFADIAFNLAFVSAAALLLLTAPFAGALLDARAIRRIVGLRISTALMACAYGGSAIAAVVSAPVVSLILFVFGLYAFLVSFVFYTPLLNDIASPQERGKISGYGVAANFLGQIVALVAVLPLATGAFSFFGGSPRAETLLPATIAFGICALPMLLWFKEDHDQTDSQEFSSAFARMMTQTKSLFLAPSIALFFVVYFLANDAILTTASNFSIFLEQVWNMSDTIKTYILLGIFATTAIGGIFSGHVADRFGHKRTFVCVLAGWLVIFPLLALVTNFVGFAILTTLLGFWFGAHWTVSRSVMAYLAPEKNRNLAFGYFGIAERASSFVGPLAWGLIASGLVSYGSDRYRIAMFAMTLFIAGALVALARVRSDRAN